MRIKPASVIVVASLIVGGAIVMAAVQLTEGKPNPPTPRATRSNPWVAEVKSALKNAATAEESFATSSGGFYTAEIMELEGEGLQPTDNVTIVVVHASELGYCIEAAHARLTHKMWHYTSDGGQPRAGVCRLS
jgi:hypothetical protein